MRPRARRLLREVGLSLRLLAAHPLRTALGASAVVVGIAAAVVMAAVAAGAERRVLARVRALGTDLVIVSAAPARRVAGRQRQVEVQTLLRPRDAAALLAGSGLARAAAPAVNRSVVVHANGLRVPTTLTGTTPEGLEIRGIRAANGRSFDEQEDRERRRVALLGRAVARNLFGQVDPVGRTVLVGAVPFEVLGVLAPRGTDVGGTDLDNVIVVPLETAMRRVLNIPYVHSLFVQARGAAQLDALEAEVRGTLDALHPSRSGEAAPFVVQNQAVLLRMERGAMRALRRLTVGVSLLALVVGGVGVLAVMLLAVRERVREIGLRRAVGARRRDIRRQFLLESLLLTAGGGTTGVLLGLGAAGAAALLGPWDLVVPWGAGALGLACCAGLGLGLGMLPAARAARIEPIEALRS